jgi:hypothetical protein
MQCPIINAIRLPAIEDLAGNIEGSEVSPEERPKDGAAATIRGKRKGKHRQINCQYQQTNELDVRPVQATIERGLNPT